MGYNRGVKFTVPIPEKVSLNKIYAGIHFRQRSLHKQQYHLCVLAAKLQPYDGPFPVHIKYHFRLHGSRLDSLNLAYMAKMVEDALVHVGVLPDDDPRYVESSTLSSSRDTADEVVITITPCATL